MSVSNRLAREMVLMWELLAVVSAESSGQRTGSLKGWLLVEELAESKGKMSDNLLAWQKAFLLDDVLGEVWGWPSVCALASPWAHRSVGRWVES